MECWAKKEWAGSGRVEAAAFPNPDPIHSPLPIPPHFLIPPARWGSSPTQRAPAKWPIASATSHLPLSFDGIRAVHGPYWDSKLKRALF